jgi:hypothetical protein
MQCVCSWPCIHGVVDGMACRGVKECLLWLVALVASCCANDVMCAIDKKR